MNPNQSKSDKDSQERKRDKKVSIFTNKKTLYTWMNEIVASYMIDPRSYRLKMDIAIEIEIRLRERDR